MAGSCSEIVHADQGRDERWSDPFQVDRELADCNVARQVLLVNPSEGAQKVAQRRPKALNGVDMHLAYAVPILVPRPFPIAVADGLSVSFDLVVSLPFVGVDRCKIRGVSMDMWTQALPIGAAKHSQAHLSALSTDGADNWGAIVLIRPVSLCFVGPAPRRIFRVTMRLSFFPPRSETSRRSRFARRTAVSRAGAGWRSPEAAGGSHVPSFGSDPVLGPSSRCSSPEQHPAKARRPSRAAGDAPRRPFRCRACRFEHTPYSARLATGCTWFGGSGKHSASRSRSAGTAGLRGGNAVGARCDSDHGRQDRREESPYRYLVTNRNRTSQEVGPAPPLHSF